MNVRAPIVWFSDVPADFHNVESRTKFEGLRGAGYRMLFVDQLGVSNPRMGNLGKVGRYLRRRAGSHAGGARAPADGLQLLVVPPRHHRLTDAVNVRWLERQIKGRVAALSLDRPILWFRFPSPELVALLGRLDERLVIYECLDRYANFGYPPRATAALQRAEERLLRSADVTLVTSRALHRFAAQLCDRVELQRVGVDYGRFAAAETPPSDLTRLPRPRLGYIGALDERVDVQLIADVARDHPQGSVVLLGPTPSGTDARRLRLLPNCHLLGVRPHAAMPRYLAGLDVGLLPYRSTPVTEYVFPVKALEYLAAGLPCVATGLPELTELGHVIAVQYDGGAFRRAVAEAARGGGAGTVASRRAVAEQFCWPARIRGLAAIVEDAETRRARREPGTPARDR